jgi:transcriptional regulator with XRE-family HTH domain
MTIGERIKKLRIELGMSQPELAKKCGWGEISYTKKGRYYIKGQLRISDYERGHRMPSNPALSKLAQNLHVSLSFLLEGNNEKNNA